MRATVLLLPHNLLNVYDHFVLCTWIQKSLSLGVENIEGNIENWVYLLWLDSGFWSKEKEIISIGEENALIGNKMKKSFTLSLHCHFICPNCKNPPVIWKQSSLQSHLTFEFGICLNWGLGLFWTEAKFRGLTSYWPSWILLQPCLKMSSDLATEPAPDEITQIITIRFMQFRCQLLNK